MRAEPIAKPGLFANANGAVLTPRKLLRLRNGTTSEARAAAEIHHSASVGFANQMSLFGRQIGDVHQPVALQELVGARWQTSMRIGLPTFR